MTSPSTDGKCRVVICDDHAVVRAGLRLLIESSPDLTVVAEAGNFVDGAEAVRRHRPEVVTVDVSMPGGDAFEFLRKLRTFSPQTRSVVLTMHEDEGYFRQAVAAGASGFVLKRSADSEFLTAIRNAAAGRFFASADLNATSPFRGTSNPSAEPLLDKLSKRELEVLHLLALGMTNQSIADRMILSVKTIESYRSRLLRKLHLKSRADIVDFAIKTGLLKFGV